MNNEMVIEIAERYGWLENVNHGPVWVIGEDALLDFAKAVFEERHLRKDVLLKAAYDLLKKCDESRYVLNAMSTTVYYDDAQCDGTCLMNDIAVELGIDDVAFIGEEE